MVDFALDILAFFLKDDLLQVENVQAFDRRAFHSRVVGLPAILRAFTFRGNPVPVLSSASCCSHVWRWPREMCLVLDRAS